MVSLQLMWLRMSPVIVFRRLFDRQENLQTQAGTALLLTLCDNKLIRCVVALEAG